MIQTNVPRIGRVTAGRTLRVAGRGLRPLLAHATWDPPLHVMPVKTPLLNEAGASLLENSPYQAALPEQSGYFKNKM
jgi:hypothetical protein